jgi:uncharacterized membrane protein YgcG
MPVRVLNQKSWFKGLNASVSDASQPKGSLARMSNLNYLIRGSLRVIDGNLGFATLNGAGPTTGQGLFEDINLYQFSNNVKYYLALQKDITTQLAAPTGLVATDGGAGGTLAAGTYFYVVTALDGAGGETTASNESNVTIAVNHKINLNWTAVPFAVGGYNVYRSLTTGTELLLVGAGLPATTNSFIDTGSATIAATVYNLLPSPNGAFRQHLSVGASLTFHTVAPPTPIAPPGSTFTIAGCTPSSFNGPYTSAGVTPPNVLSLIISGGATEQGGGGTMTVMPAPPSVNSTQTTALLKITNTGSYTKPGSILATFPADPPILQVPSEDGTGGGFGGGGSGGGGVGGGGTSGGGSSAGGVVGNTSTTPLLVPFVKEMILALGNGFPPQQWNNSTATPLGNTFTASFPPWAASIALIAGAVIVPTAPNGHLYKAIQGGSTGTVQPTFPTASGATVAETTPGSIIWQEAGSTSTPAPRGAAHAIVYAGSLWLWNTQPTTTADNLDGPSVLKMSDVNNPNSWNPVNTAFVGKDDGQQGMGMGTFTIAESGIPPEGSLVLFKEFSTYQVIGVFGSSNFQIQRAQTELGCIAPRTIKFVPGFGIIRLSHLGVAVFDGVRDRIISEEIRPYLFGGVSDIAPLDLSFAYFAKGDLVADPPMYCIAIPVLGQGGDGRLTRILCFDLVLKAWSVVDLPSAGISVFRQIYSPGSIPITIWGGMSNGMVSRWQAGDDQGFDAWTAPSGVVTLGSNIPFSFRTNSAIQENPTDRLYIRRAIVKGVIGAKSLAPIKVGCDVVVNKIDPMLNAPPLQLILEPLPATTDTSFEYVVDVNQVGLDAYFNLVGTHVAVAPGTVGFAPYVQFDSIDWHVQARPAGALVRIS